ncbi:MAG: aldehyde dehydrogenase [Acidimicrobiales bacterium]|nr:aldehyde dehydrogenase [Acidimicrobiales bacterium]
MDTLDSIFVGGEWVAATTGDRLEVDSPATEEIIGTVPDAGPAEMDAAVAAAKGAFAGWAATSADERIETLSRVSQVMQGKAQELAEVISAEVGTPINQSLMMQVFASTMVLDNYVNAAKNFPWVEHRQGSLGQNVQIHRHPVGVCAGIVPWNVPLFIACMKLGPVLATGSTMVLKASPETPLHTRLLAECLNEAGVPPGVVNIVAAGASGSEYLVRHPDVDKVSFTGSVATGSRVGAICGEQIKRCTLELGGKSAAIMLDDVDLDAVMGDLVMSGLLNTGQACGAQTRMLAPASRYDEIAEALGAAVSAVKVGEPSDAEAVLGPLVSAKQRDKVLGYIAAGKEQGATAVCGGGTGEWDKGYYVEPTVFRDVTNDMTIAREEIFGPVLSLIKYETVDEAIAIANDSDFGLSGSVWTTDTDRAAEVGSQIRTGVVAVNSAAILDMASPFGGFKKSGIGRELGPEGIAQLTEVQSILLPAG